MQRRNDSGFSLVAALVSAAIIGILAVALSRMYSAGILAGRSTELRADLQSIKKVINDTVDCSQTVNPLCAGGVCAPGIVPTCPTGTVAVYKHSQTSGALLIDSGGTTYGSWTLTATCTSHGINVQATRPNGTGGYFKDQLTGRLLDDNFVPGRIFYTGSSGNGTALCQSYFAGSPSKHAMVVMPNSFPITGGDGVYQDTGFGITLPAAGTYLILADISAYIQTDTGHNGNIYVKLFDVAKGADIDDSKTMVVHNYLGADNWTTASLHLILSVNQSTTLELYAARGNLWGGPWLISQISSTSGGVPEARTRLSYVRLD